MIIHNISRYNNKCVFVDLESNIVHEAHNKKDLQHLKDVVESLLDDINSTLDYMID